MEGLYEKKLQTIENVINHVDNGRVPIVSMAQTWAIAYAGGTAAECKADPKRECEIYGKHLKDMYFDATLLFGLNRPLQAYEGLGFEPYFISPDGITLQCNPDLSMVTDEDLDRFIQDPAAFLREVGLARRYPGLQGDPQAVLGQLLRSMGGLMDFVGRAQIRNEYLIKECQTPALVHLDLFSPTFDQYFMYRGVVKGLTDIRRRPQKVLEACDAMIPLCSIHPNGAFPLAFNPIVSATYLSTSQFEKFFWPSYKKMCDAFLAEGGRAVTYLESKWGEKVEFFNEFPANSFVVLLEEDDYFEVAKKIGDKVAVGYPFPQQLLCSGSVEEVKTEAKRVIDKIGTKGTFFAVDKALLSLSDAKPENYAALCEISQTYHP